MTEFEVYQFYNDTVKIVYSDIEARGNILPVELLFEIHSAFDHLKRFHLNEEAENTCAEKALSHLQRCVLDAFKLKLKYYNDDFTKLNKYHLDSIDNGEYIVKLFKTRTEIIAQASLARRSESSKNKDKAFIAWQETSKLIEYFYSNLFDSGKISWARKKSIWEFIKRNILGFVFGLITSILAAFIWNFITK